MSAIFKSKTFLYILLAILILIIISLVFLIVEDSSDYTLINTIVNSDYSFYIVQNINRTFSNNYNHEEPGYEMRLQIPAINIDTPVILDTDIMDERNITDLPVHYQMSDFPSDLGGNVAIAGHRTAKVFLFLDRLQKGDLIYIDFQNIRYTYTVKEKYLTASDDWSVIETTQEPTITLTTCDRPVGEPKERLIIKGILTATD